MPKNPPIKASGRFSEAPAKKRPLHLWVFPAAALLGIVVGTGTYIAENNVVPGLIYAAVMDQKTLSENERGFSDVLVKFSDLERDVGSQVKQQGEAVQVAVAESRSFQDLNTDYKNQLFVCQKERKPKVVIREVIHQDDQIKSDLQTCRQQLHSCSRSAGGEP
jgi:hypothetical protein